MAKKKQLIKLLDDSGGSILEHTAKRYKVAAKVIDIFGNDTMKIVEVGV